MGRKRAKNRRNRPVWEQPFTLSEEGLERLMKLEERDLRMLEKAGELDLAMPDEDGETALFRWPIEWLALAGDLGKKDQEKALERLRLRQLRKSLRVVRGRRAKKADSGQTPSSSPPVLRVIRGKRKGPMGHGSGG